MGKIIFGLMLLVASLSVSAATLTLTGTGSSTTGTSSSNIITVPTGTTVAASSTYVGTINTTIEFESTYGLVSDLNTSVLFKLNGLDSSELVTIDLRSDLSPATPIPAALWLFGSVLLGAFGLKRGASRLVLLQYNRCITKQRGGEYIFPFLFAFNQIE